MKDIYVTHYGDDPISPWAEKAVGNVLECGVMGYVGDLDFLPKAIYTREQSILTMMRMYNLFR